MGNKVFYGVLAILAIGIVGFIVFSNSNEPPKEQTLGTQYADLGTKHVPEGTKVNYNSNPPSSGDHFQSPAPLGFYQEEIPDGAAIHNLEHGYIWVAYRPDLPADQIQKLKALFFKPFSNPDFKPSKVIVTKRPTNPAPISIVSWRWTMNLDSYDGDKLMQFYLQHVSKSPEAAAS